MKSHILYILSIIFFALQATSAFGQNRDGTGGLCKIGGGSFTVTPQEACANAVIRISNTMPNSPTVHITTNYDEITLTPNGVRNLTSTSYATAGSYTVLQVGINSNGQEFSKCEVVKVYENRPINTALTACGGGSVILAITDDAISKAYDRIEVDWGDNTEIITINKGGNLSVDHTYTEDFFNAKPIIKVIGYYEGKACEAGRLKTIPVDFVRPDLAKIRIKSIEMTRAGKLSIYYFGVTGVSTNLMYSNNQGSSYNRDGVKTQGGENVPYTYNATLIPSQSYVLQLQSSDLCKNTLSTPTATSMRISGVATDQQSNQITWNQYPVNNEFTKVPNNFTKYELIRDGEVIETFTDISKSSYTDEDVICGNIYEYRIKAYIGELTSTSAPLDITAQSSKTGLENATVSVIDNNTVEVSVDLPGTKLGDSYELSFSRAEAGNALYKRLPTIAGENTYLDKETNTTEKSYCYKIIYTNSCGIRFPTTQPICTILLKDDKLPTLNWSKDSPMLGELDNYEIVENGVAENVALNTTYSPSYANKSLLEYSFQVVANSKDKKFQSFSNRIDFSKNMDVYLPDAFSPNDDGFNDTFYAKGNLNLLKSFKMVILNRWGKPIFSSEDLKDGWDGNVNGTKAPEGSYIYAISYDDILGQTVKKRGTFMLLR